MKAISQFCNNNSTSASEMVLNSWMSASINKEFSVSFCDESFVYLCCSGAAQSTKSSSLTMSKTVSLTSTFVSENFSERGASACVFTFTLAKRSNNLKTSREGITVCNVRVSSDSEN